jgi:integrase
MGSCDRDSVAGRRDFAILVLLARLGLRAGEVAALDLGDIRWRQGETRRLIARLEELGHKITIQPAAA